MNILINVPDLNIIGGKSNYYSALKEKFSPRISYFTYGSRGKQTGKIGTIKRMVSDYVNFYRTIKKKNIKLVVLNPSLEFKGFFRDGIFFLITRFLPVKTIVFWRGWSLEFEKEARGKYRRFMDMSFMKADAKIVLAKEFEEKVREWGFKKPVHLETTVVDEDLVQGLDSEWISKKEKEKADKNLLFLARLEKNKGIFEIMDSYQELKPRYPELSLTIAGTGSAFDEVQTYIKQNQIEDVKMVGFVQGQAKAKAFHDADIYLFPSSHGEGMPNSLLEAMGCGLPVITTANAGIKDFFKDEEMGLILNDINREELAEKIDKILKDNHLKRNMSLYNFQYAEGHFYASVVAKRLEGIFDEVLGK
ncbi:MAG: glycosyltransferase family 4 protein [Bacteroidetes bacterium]|nr:glycosyltransferase family 4 protein [Bacteroidota bacterium]